MVNGWMDVYIELIWEKLNHLYMLLYLRDFIDNMEEHRFQNSVICLWILALFFLAVQPWTKYSESLVLFLENG